MIWTDFQEHNIDLTFPDIALHFPDKMPVMPVTSSSETPKSHLAISAADQVAA
jgi:small-conductance mechanosensitive channel